MLACQCNVIMQREVEAAILALLQADRWRLIVPAAVYHALGRRGRCCRCFPGVAETIVRVTEAFHAQADADEAQAYLEEVRGLRLRWAKPAAETRPGAGAA
ncbi:MAG: (2Fe-2S)-binding protein [Mesorhizobium amorphae]|nr:MAG: (2Fe-2S)-binding protein [Mesorhizobium amorphae]